MPKYEIMFLLDSECSEKDSAKEVEPLLNLFKKEKEYKLSVSWSDQLAYKVKKREKAHRYLLNFITNDFTKIEEFKRLSDWNNKILRYLIINIEKSYGYRNSINPKKILQAEIRAKRYEEFKSKRESKSINNKTPQRPHTQTI